jgi:hypothetical protein
MSAENAKKRRDAKLSKWLRELLGRNAPIEFQIEADLLTGDPGKTNAEIIAEKVVEAAREGKQWAIELIHDRTEGKPVQAVKQDEGDRSVEERIEDVTVQHLNDLARKLAAVGDGGSSPLSADSPEPENPKPHEYGAGSAHKPAAPARSLLDLPQDRDRDSQDA